MASPSPCRASSTRSRAASITAFAETSPTNALPPAAGLFTWLGAPAVPAAGTLVTGLAGQIKLNAAMDSAQGGNPELLRDGGANGAGYVHNTGNNASYSGLLLSYWRPHECADRLRSQRRHRLFRQPQRLFDRLDRLVRRLAQGSFERRRIQGSARRAHGRGASNETGVNVDMEMSLLLDLEHSYEASSRLIRAVDEMLAALLDAVR